MPIIAPSILASDFANLQNEVEMLNESAADWIHIDIMDGVFVPNISFGLPVCHAIKRHSSIPMDVHLMIERPENYVEAFMQAGADVISIHYEACNHLHRNIQQLHDLGVKAGVAINPHTPVSSLHDIIADIDLVCLMSVNPGFGGQKFIDRTFSRLQELRELIDSTSGEHKALIEIDGGVTSENAQQLVDMGADVLVAGSFVFKSSAPSNTIASLKNVTPA